MSFLRDETREFFQHAVHNTHRGEEGGGNGRLTPKQLAAPPLRSSASLWCVCGPPRTRFVTCRGGISENLRKLAISRFCDCCLAPALTPASCWLPAGFKWSQVPSGHPFRAWVPSACVTGDPLCLITSDLRFVLKIQTDCLIFGIADYCLSENQ